MGWFKRHSHDGDSSQDQETHQLGGVPSVGEIYLQWHYKKGVEQADTLLEIRVAATK